MTEFRIILRGGMYIVQRKGLFGWSDCVDGNFFDLTGARIRRQQLEGSDTSRPVKVVE